ncbi:MAG TPA: DUF1800 family protein, partial [Chitinolyticbacter sp.]|nr:DUF1800 family protein [Chitinolyticbacter sp.]
NCKAVLASTVLALLLAACGGGGGDSGSDTAAPTPLPTPVPLPASSVLPPVSQAQWDETAVRNVLHTFAYGGQASDAQIQAWTQMAPQAAIVEMLTFAPFNPKLSPGHGEADPLRASGGTLAGLSRYWSGDSSPMPSSNRASFDYVNDWSGVQRTGLQAGITQGLNPFLHRVLFWETNYHLAVNQGAGVEQGQIVRYYDTLLNALANGESYSRVLARAAMSAAIARQYGHNRNEFNNTSRVFRGNEDFAREFHQLFFGILGTTRPEDATPRAAGEDSYHEVVTVKNTARMLTDMTEQPQNAEELTFGTAKHHAAALEILHSQIAGATARDKIFALAEVAIRHPESEANLPVKIIQGLANDYLGEADMAQLRSYWQQQGQSKDLLAFLQTYAISAQFHQSSRAKYLTPLERNLIFLNRFALNRTESEFTSWYSPIALITWDEGFTTFSPTHNVFGHQTSEEASLSAELFKTVYNRSVDSLWRVARVDSIGDANLTEQAPGWEKNWGALAPREADGSWRTDRVAAWLWQRFTGNSLADFGDYERLYTYSLLATGRDAGFYCTGNGAAGTNPDYVFGDADFAANAPGARCLAELADDAVALASSDSEIRKTANRRVAYAVAFLTALPQAQLLRGE